MDNAVALVQAYLRINGYFTVAEYPVVEAMRRGGHRTATDIDILAFRFPSAGRLVPHAGSSAKRDRVIAEPDPTLKAPPDIPDMLIGEVKEGRAELNAAATDPTVLRTVLVRFGCCRPEESDSLVESLMRTGRAEAASGHGIRMIAFGVSAPQTLSSHFTTVLLRDVVGFLQAYITEHWEVLRHAEFKDPAFGFLVTLFKAGQSGGGSAGISEA